MKLDGSSENGCGLLRRGTIIEPILCWGDDEEAVKVTGGAISGIKTTNEQDRRSQVKKLFQGKARDHCV